MTELTIQIHRYAIAYSNSSIFSWVRDNKVGAYYTWPYTDIILYTEEDATAFMLKFGGKVIKRV